MKAEALNMSDEELVKQCINGNQGAQKLLFDKYSSTVSYTHLRAPRD